MTYGELLQKLYEFTPIQLQQPVTVFDGEEYFSILEIEHSLKDAILDKNQYVLIKDFGD